MIKIFNKKIPLLKKLLIIFSILAMIFIILFFSLQLYVDNFSKPYIYNDKANFPNCDAVMVLGASVYKNGTPSPILKERLLQAYELYKEGYAKKIIVSGDHGSDDYDEVNTMKNFLIEKGIKDEDIFMDHAGFDTYDSMYRAKMIFKVNSLIISTQNFHIKRAVYISRKLGTKAYGYPSEDKKQYNMAYLNFRESFAKIKAVLETDILKRKPKHLGQSIPIWKSGTLTNDK